MDLSTIDCQTKAEAGVDMKLLHPGTGLPILDGDGAPHVFKVLGKDSKRYNDRQNKLLANRVESGNDPDELSMRLLSCVVVDWSSNVHWKGQPLECTEANVILMFKAQRWIFDQVDRFTASRANFLGN